MSVQDYVARFDGLTFFCYMGEDCYQGISRFCSVWRFDLERAMLISSDHVDSRKRGISSSFRVTFVFLEGFISKTYEHCSKIGLHA